jgi:hypothetical protein
MHPSYAVACKLLRFVSVVGLLAVLSQDSLARAGTRADPEDAYAIVFTALSDDFTINGHPAVGKRNPADLGRLINSSNPEVAALAKDAQSLVSRRLQVKVATELWRRGAKSPQGISDEFVKNVLREYVRPGAPALEDRNLTDDLIAALQTSVPNNVRVLSTIMLLDQLEQVQTKTLLPVLRSRFPRASPDGGSVSMSARIEKKLPAEMTLTNTGSKPLHNVVVWFQIEMGPLPGMSKQQLNDLRAVSRLGLPKAAATWKANRELQNKAVAMGSRNLAFIPELKPKASAKITYELGTVRYSKRAVFSLCCDELKITDQEIAGVRAMQQAIEKRFGPKR